MRNGHRIGVVIPARNEENAIGLVLADLPAWVDAVVVADNGSVDRTAEIARMFGATVAREPDAGYGAACQAGLARLPDVDIIVFADGDHSDHVEDMALLVDPIIGGAADLVVGSRALGGRAPGSMTPPQIFGNWLATRLMRLFWGAEFTDLGPFRAISREALASLEMADRTFGWTVEMQLKAITAGLTVREVPVRYRRRVGVSKISGTVRGTILAGAKIMYLIGRHVWVSRGAARPRGKV